LLASGERLVCFATADDWLNLYENESTAHKTRSWLHQPATERQLQYLSPAYRHDYSLTRYKASAMMTMQFNRQAIMSAINNGRVAA
jgi:DNA repair protein RadD